MAAFYDPENKPTSECGTIYTMAPEVILRKPQDKKVDAYSLGIVLYEMLCHEKPFYSKNTETLRKKIVSDKISFKPIIFKYVSKDAKDLISKLT